ncbi:hypothetical protein JCM10908_000908 [Rhodotorula pacifica]|uniref:cytochrome and DOMON domain-containing protein n=1 Tax=Rhodotorula pacifica TaxID=1495444 RepID=UPI00317939A7
MLRYTTLLSLLPLWAHVANALSADQIQQVFGSTQSLVGATRQLPRFNLSIVSNSSHALYVLNSSTPVSSIGWLGTGTGSSMGNADYIIAWPDVSGSSANWTLSHRVPGHSSHDMPMLASSSAGTDTQSYYQLVPELSTSDPSSRYGAVAFLRVLKPGSSYPSKSGVQTSLASADTQFIYASGSKNPGSSSDGASFAQHDQPKGSTSFNLTMPVVLSALAASSAGPNDMDGGSSGGGGSGGSNRNILIAHAVLGSVAFMILSPAAILIARFGRDRMSWFPPHWVLNLLSVILVIITFALGTYATGNEWNDTHKRLGLALFILVLLQATLGLVGHRTRRTHLTSSRPSSGLYYNSSPKRPSFPFTRISHVVLGLVTIGLGYWQIETGISDDGEWNSKAENGKVPKSVQIIFWILLGVEVAAYAAAWIWHIAARVTKGPLDDASRSPGRPGRASDENTLMDERPVATAGKQI